MKTCNCYSCLRGDAGGRVRVRADPAVARFDAVPDRHGARLTVCAGAGRGPVACTCRSVRELSRRAKPGPAPALDGRTLVARPRARPSSSTQQRRRRENKVRLAQAYCAAGHPRTTRTSTSAEAARLDPHESAAWDGLARIWRDWGFPAVAPGRCLSGGVRSPDVTHPRTTRSARSCRRWARGGRPASSSRQALALDPAAAYAPEQPLLLVADGGRRDVRPGRVPAGSGRSTPQLVPARNNLALARALAGDLEGAAAIFGAVERRGGRAVQPRDRATSPSAATPPPPMPSTRPPCSNPR